jgi:hypothetical protein
MTNSLYCWHESENNLSTPNRLGQKYRDLVALSNQLNPLDMPYQSSYVYGSLVTSLRGNSETDVACKVPELCRELQLRLTPNCVTLTKKQCVVSITSGTEGWMIELSHTRRRELGASLISSESSFRLWFVIEMLPTTMVLFIGYPH